LYDYGVTVYADTLTVTEEFLAANRALLVRWLRASRQGWVENFKDPAKYPHVFESSFFKGTGRSTDNDVYGSGAEKPLIESSNGIFAMSEEGIAANIQYLKSIGIAADRAMFDTSLLEQV
jgi:hypothetical protein